MHENRQIVGLITTFIRVAELGSFKRGAEAIGRSPSAVTAQITQLEELLTVQLLLRTTRNVQLTAAGQELLERGRKLVNQADRLVRDFQGRSARFVGNVEVSVSPTIAVSLLPVVLEALAVNHPEARVTLREALRSDALDAVEQGLADFGIGPYSDVPPTLSFTPVFDQNFRLILPRHHAIARRGFATPGDLRGLELLCPSPGSTARAVLEELAREGGFEVVPRYETLQYPTLYALVAGGLGVTVMPVVDPLYLESQRLAAVPFTNLHVARTIGIITRVEGELSPISLLFIETLKASALKLAEHFHLGNVASDPETGFSER